MANRGETGEREQKLELSKRERETEKIKCLR